MLLQTKYNEVVVLQHDGDSSVHNSRCLMGKVTDARKFMKEVRHKVRCSFLMKLK